MIRINPAQVTLELERVGHKSVPVHVRLVGRPPPDMQVGDTKVSPEMVQVTGPASDVEDVHAANTEALDISKAGAGTIERELPLDSAGEYLSFSATRVAVQVRIEEVPVTREFKRVAVEVHGATHGFRLAPDTVRLVVRGPKHLMSDLELAAEAVSVDATGQAAGEHTVKPTVDLPAGVQLVSIEPAEIHLTVLPPKRGKRGRR